MEPDARPRINKPDHELPEERDETLPGKSAGPEVESSAEPESAIPEPLPSGVGARFRKLMQASPKRAGDGILKRELLKEDRTKTFVMLAGGLVILALFFIATFSSPSSSRKVSNSTRPNEPNLGRGRGAGNAANPDHSVTPLLNADTRQQDESSGAVTPEDIRKTAKLRMQPAQAGNASTMAPTGPKAEPKDYALNKIDFPAEAVSPNPAPVAAPAAAPTHVTKASLVFVRSTTGAHDAAVSSAITQQAILSQPSDFTALPAGARLVARLQTPVSSAVKAPVVAAIEYNYERDGEIVIPAGTKAFGELEQANEQGTVSIRFNSIQMPDQNVQRIDGRAMSLRYEPLRGNVTGRNSGRRFLVRAMTGVGTIAAATVGVRTGTGLSEPITNNVLLRERVANNIAIGGEQQLAEIANHQNIVITVPGNMRFYIVLAKPGGNATFQSSPVPASSSQNPGLSATSQTTVQELRELMDLKRELTQMYRQPQQNSTIEPAPAPQP
jgi:hypothetical protein